MPQVQVLSPRPFSKTVLKKLQKILQKDLTSLKNCDIINKHSKQDAGVAQLVEQLICNQQVGGSSPSTSSIESAHDTEVDMGEFPSGQRGQTVNLLAMPSMVRIHLPPPKILHESAGFLLITSSLFTLHFSLFTFFAGFLNE